ncbi:solute carrier family 8 member 4a isoform X1 [Syngnathoides biaculeatus]|uniref:solute carrier family 8 member 4a isoform X1 n=1 Tax=Syngnathoides biaculeatus TaxID=300417 RepID=UPI002ADE41BD|nr:solute carrier family 8 member 4a isoform X1 [Syngnathoides biaculeatus]XP_061660003.1 solute carrier family 8 member 4a isoform X1 [Syngnathoides biaculeatus]
MSPQWPAPSLGPCVSVSVLLLALPGVTQVSRGSADHRDNCTGEDNCSDGVVLPMWNPQNPVVGDKVARAIVYFAALVYMFLGMSIIADRFMSSIEVITSQEKEITVKKPNGETTTATVRVWNETVSNLTLMALGSSAPEILLSVIEVVGHNFESGSLGPSTIVGSAAFNMFIIIAICVYVVPENETRKIKHLRVFFVTAAWSIFAYIWLYLILSVFSPGEVEVWEAVLTFLFFPLCVLQAWMADRRLLFYRYVGKRYRADKNRGIVVESEGDAMFAKMDSETDGHPKEASDGMPEGVEEGAEQDQEEEARREMARTLKELKQRHPDKDMEQLIEMANYQVLVQQQKSRAFYRIQATRMMIGAGNILKKHAADQARKVVSCHEASGQEEDPNTVYLQFDPSHYQCFENCGSLKLSVSRHGGEAGCTVKVDYRTEDGTANAGSDYEFAEGTLVFKPGETTKEFSVGVIDDDIFEEDEHFYVRLSNPRVAHRAEVSVLEPRSLSSGGAAGGSCRVPPKAALGAAHTATVTIYDDDHAGIFTFEGKSTRVSESVGNMRVKVHRTSGARGKVAVPYHTVEGTAKAGEDYEEVSGKLEFQNDETMKLLDVKIIDDEEYEKNKTFSIILEEPVLLEVGQRHGDSNDNKTPVGPEDVAKMGCPCLGEHTSLEVVIEESYEFKVRSPRRPRSASPPIAFVRPYAEHRGQADQKDQLGPGGGQQQLEGAVRQRRHRQRRRRRRGRKRRRAAALLLRLHHALPDGVLESALRLRPAHRVLERLGLLPGVHLAHRRPDGGDRRPGLSLRLHGGPEGLRDRRGLRGLGHVGPRHVRQQGGRHPGPVRRRLHRERDRQQRRQRVPGHRGGVDHRLGLLEERRQEFQGGAGLAGLLRHAVHRHGAGVRAGAALPPPSRRLGRRAGRPADSQAADLLPLPVAVAGLHPAVLAGGLLPRSGILRTASGFSPAYPSQLRGRL